jgi:hypothetical protein
MEGKVDEKEDMNITSSGRRRSWGRESRRRSGAPFLLLNARPSEVRKGSVEESAVRKGDELVSHRFSGRRWPVALVATAGPLHHRRRYRERRGATSLFLTGSGFCPWVGWGYFETRWNEGFRGGIGRVTTPVGFNQTCSKNWPGLNPSELDPGCQTGIGIHFRQGWGQLSEA